MPGQEGVILRLGVKECGHGVCGGAAVHRALQQLQQLLEGTGGIVGGAESRPNGGEAVAVLGEDGVSFIQLQRLDKALAQALEEMQRPAQKDDFPRKGPSLGQAGHRLIHHRLEDGSGDILLAPALIQDGLNIALGEHAAAGGDGVNFLVPQGQLVQLGHRNIHQGGHLVNKRACAAGAGAVHPLLQRAAEKDNFCVLAAQLDHGVGVRYVGVNGGGGGVDLLHKVQSAGLGNPQTGRAGDDQLHVLPGQPVGYGAQGLTGGLSGFGIVTLVGAKKKAVLLVQHRDLHGGGADVDSDAKAHSFTS
ncbi:hypothetical protein SDC9_102551 [bioreactor metagenome]|uniref:Uncharacterized protein n=1 Tax=bioreactor metagenome TaxID=1076179 RepID=A0A645B213_9ZZZZ